MTTPYLHITLCSQRLSQITHAPHDQLDKTIKAYAPFETLASYTRFVSAQYLFQAELQSLYKDPALKKLFADLPERCRAEQARADLVDLGVEPPRLETGAQLTPSMAEALGWLFVSEGSKLGAAFLIKRAVGLGLSEQFGARHLGEPAGGRAAGWKRFISILDSLPLTNEQETQLNQGALAAFERFNVLLRQAYAQASGIEVA